MLGLKNLSMALAAAAIVVAPVAGWAAPVPAVEMSKLEQRTKKECEEAGEILGKVQAGKMDYKAAMKKLREFKAHAEELSEKEGENVAEEYLQELNQTIFWTKKFMPMDFGFTKPKPPPAAKDEPAKKKEPATKEPATKEPAKKETPAPEPAVERRPPPKRVQQITWEEIVMPAFDQNIAMPELPEQVHPRAKVVLPLFDDGNVEKRVWAGVVSPTCPTPQLIKKCFDVLRTGKSDRERMAAAFGLANSRHDEVFRQFDKAVDEWNEEELERLWLVMSNLPEKRTVAAMFRIVMRFERPLGGGNSETDEGVTAYMERARNVWRTGRRAKARAVWKEWPAPVVSAGLSEFFKYGKKKKKTEYMQETFLAAGALNDARLIGSCVPFMQNGREEILPLRAPAMAAAQMVGIPAVPYLIGGLTSGKTKNRCVRVLKNISNVVLASQPKLWWAWYRDNR